MATYAQPLSNTQFRRWHFLGLRVRDILPQFQPQLSFVSIRACEKPGDTAVTLHVAQTGGGSTFVNGVLVLLSPIAATSFFVTSDCSRSRGLSQRYPENAATKRLSKATTRATLDQLDPAI